MRHALPGEVVEAVVTEGVSTSRYLRADAVRIIEPSDQRRQPPCPYAGPPRLGADGTWVSGCGGCDWQHTTPAYGRELKARVVAEQVRRLAGIDVDVPVDPVPGDVDGLRWRTRMQFARTPDGRRGLRLHRSHDVIPIDDCLIARADIVDRRVDPTATVTERLTWAGGSADFAMTADGFWQVHPGAPRVFVDHVLAALAPQPGERVIDLYAGVGLFTVPLAHAVGARGRVVAAEGAARAVAFGRRNTAGLPQVSWLRGDVAQLLRFHRSAQGRADLVVLDPPRKGAGRAVVEAITARAPRLTAYIACDPAALARDLKTFADRGYGLRSIRAFDAFPMTQHVETIAVLEPR